MNKILPCVPCSPECLVTSHQYRIEFKRDKLNFGNVRQLWLRTFRLRCSSQEIVSLRDLYRMRPFERMKSFVIRVKESNTAFLSMQIKVNEREEFKWCGCVCETLPANPSSSRDIGPIRFDMVSFRRISSNHSDTLLTSRHCFPSFSLFGSVLTRGRHVARRPKRAMSNTEMKSSELIFFIYFIFPIPSG